MIVEGGLLLERNLELEEGEGMGTVSQGSVPPRRILEEMRKTIGTRGRVPFSIPFSGYGSGHRFQDEQ